VTLDFAQALPISLRQLTLAIPPSHDSQIMYDASELACFEGILEVRAYSSLSTLLIQGVAMSVARAARCPLVILVHTGFLHSLPTEQLVEAGRDSSDTIHSDGVDQARLGVGRKRHSAGSPDDVGLSVRHRQGQ
jgi:hypothetical protein